MLPVRPRRGPLSLELGLGVGMLVCALAALPLGLDRVGAAPAVAAGLELGRSAAALGAGDAAVGGESAPPLVVLLLRLFACLPLGDLAMRANLAAVACAVAAAVLLGRLGFRVLRAIEPAGATLGRLEGGVAAARGPAEVAPSGRDPGLGQEVPAAGEDTEREGLVPIVPGAGGEPPLPVRAEPWPWPARRPQLRVLPGSAPARGPAHAPSLRPWGGSLGGMAPPPRSMMRASASRRGGTGARSAGPGVEPPATHETFALFGAIACALGSLGAFLALTAAPAAAVSLVLVVAAWLQLLAFDRRPGTPRRGLALALLAGLAIGADPVAALFIWPAATWTCLRLLRQGERWPLLAPGAFLVGAAVVAPWLPAGLPGAASARAAWSVLATLSAAFTSRAGLVQLLAAGREIFAQWGVVAGLTGLVGAAVLLGRRPRWFGFGVGSGVVALALVTGDATVVGGPRFVPGGAAWVVLSSLIAVPLMLGIIRLASTLGRARGAGALCLAVVAASWPLLDGGSLRFRRSSGFPEALLERAEEQLAPGVVVDPGSPEMAKLFRYGEALGLRPDLLVIPAKRARGGEGLSLAPPIR
jgi:hypothetical protein